MTWYLCGIDANDNVTQYETSEIPVLSDSIASLIDAYPETVAVFADTTPIRDLDREPDYIPEVMEE